MYRLTIRICSDDTIRPNTNTLFGPLFGTEANTKRIFGISLEQTALVTTFQLSPSSSSVALIVLGRLQTLHEINSTVQTAGKRRKSASLTHLNNKHFHIHIVGSHNEFICNF